MPYISEETIVEVQRSLDIHEVVSQYLPLRRAGANYKGLCPFHEEKSPSFMVHPEKQIFKCFGCGKGGTVFNFVMEQDKVTYPEAIRLLAERAGIQVKYQGGGRAGPDRTELFRLTEWTAKHYRRLLVAHPEGERARKYAEERGLSPETIETWGVGYARDSWSDLYTSARKKGFSDKALQQVGLVMARESGGFYDRFRGRLMFPIRDPQGRVVGFGGRKISEGEPKYLNSPETPLFSKGRLLYGLDKAKEAAGESETLCIVEGYFDVILPAQHGVQGLVATLGTALTREHLSLLRRYVKRVVLVFDSDEAGQRAAERGLDLLLREDMDVYVARMPAGQDPADVVTAGGPDRLRGYIEKPVEIFEFLIESVEKKMGGDTPAARSRVIEEVASKIGQVPIEIRREVLIQQLATRYGVPDRPIRNRVAGLVQVDKPARPSEEKLDAPERIGRELIELMLQHPETIERVRAEVPAERFPTLGTRRISEKLYELFEREGQVSAGDLASLMKDEEAMSAVADILSRPDGPAGTAEKRLEGCLEFLRSRDFRRQAEELQSGLRDADSKEGDRRLRKLQELRGLRNQRAVPRA